MQSLHWVIPHTWGRSAHLSASDSPLIRLSNCHPYIHYSGLDPFLIAMPISRASIHVWASDSSLNLTSISQPYIDLSASHPSLSPTSVSHLTYISLSLTSISHLTFIYQPHIRLLTTYPPAIIPFPRSYSSSSSVMSPVQTAAHILPLCCVFG